MLVKNKINVKVNLTNEDHCFCNELLQKNCKKKILKTNLLIFFFKK